MAHRTVGEQVTPTLRLVRPLGEGAMGSVWEADHLELDTRVAIKFVSGGTSLRRKALQRFRLEAQAAAKIRSPHVVTIFDFGKLDDGTPYIVMELLQGESLADVIDGDEELSLSQAAGIVTQVARGLTAAHAAGIVHRDIKPDNIFITRTSGGERVIKILDFGIAKRVEATALTAPGVVLGTAPYMSWEQVLDAAKVDHRADLWALAVVTYEMLTGALPFGGENASEIFAAIWRAEPEPPSKLRVGLTAEVDAWFERAFTSELAERPQTAKELATSLVDALVTTGELDEPDILDPISSEDLSLSLAPSRASPLPLDSDPLNLGEIMSSYEPIATDAGDSEPPADDTSVSVSDKPPVSTLSPSEASLAGVKRTSPWRAIAALLGVAAVAVMGWVFLVDASSPAPAAVAPGAATADADGEQGRHAAASEAHSAQSRRASLPAPTASVDVALEQDASEVVAELPASLPEPSLPKPSQPVSGWPPKPVQVAPPPGGTSGASTAQPPSELPPKDLGF